MCQILNFPVSRAARGAMWSDQLGVREKTMPWEGRGFWEGSAFVLKGIHLWGTALSPLVPILMVGSIPLNYSHCEHGMMSGAEASIQQSWNNKLKEEKYPVLGQTKGQKEPGSLVTIWAMGPMLGLSSSDLLSKQSIALWSILLAPNI